MAQYRQVYSTFWQDDFILSLTPEEKYFYLYLFTNSKTSMCGIYELPKKVIEFETGYNRETVDKLIKKFEEYNKVHYSLTTNEIVVHNLARYNVNRSPKVICGFKSSLEAVKDKNLIPYIYGMETILSVTETVTETVDTDKSVKPKKPIKHKYGEYKNVLLSDEDIEKLKQRFTDYQARIENLSQGIELKGYKYNNHYLVILKWAEKDKQNKIGGLNNGSNIEDHHLAGITRL